MPRPVSWQVIVPYAVMILAIVAVFGQVVGFGFSSWDDNIHVTENPLLRPVSWQRLAQIWESPYRGLYIPLSYTFFAAELWLSQIFSGSEELRPMVFHLGSLVLHAATALLVFQLLKRLTGDALAAVVGALLFALHPLQAESVAWISETRGLLSAVLGVIAMLAYLNFTGWPGPDTQPQAAAQQRISRPQWAYYALATVAFVLALLAKPSAVAIPLMLVILDVTVLRRPWRSTLVALLPWVAAAVVIAAITKSQQADDQRIPFVTPLWARPLVAADALNFYALKLVAPFKLAIHYPRAPQLVLSGWWAYLGWLTVGAVLVALWFDRRRNWLAPLGLFIAGLSPVLGLLTFSFQRFSTVADRYVYLAMLGPALALAGWIARRKTSGPIQLAALGLAACAALSFAQASLWRDDAMLYEHALRINPRSELAHCNLGGLLLDRGQVNAAMPHLQAAVDIAPAYIDARYNLGNALARQNRLLEAAAEYRTVIRLAPEHVGAHFYLSNVLGLSGDFKQAEAECRAALELEPNSDTMQYTLAGLLASQGRTHEARPYYEAALRINPENTIALLALVAIYATDADPKLRDGPRAVQLGEQLIQITGGQQFTALDMLGAAYAEVGRFEDAVATARRAAELARLRGREDFSKVVENRIALYQQRRPFHATADEPGRPSAVPAPQR